MGNHKIIEKECYHFITTVWRKDIKSPKDVALRKLQEYIMANEFAAPRYESLEFRVLRRHH